ncbi:MAG TPA: hypothetical protein PLV95_01410 [Candidatus Pacearchaeota archaeon]|nr:hypothetical protein [Candidatus Pacearchaeota archaeon]
MNILPTITTTFKANWKGKIKEAEMFELKEIALFLTCLDKNERREAYNLLSKTNIKSIPFVHLRHDMGVEELEFLIKEYNTQVFCVHSSQEYPIPGEWINLSSIIAVENTLTTWLEEKEIKRFGGICLDFAHLENDRITNLEKFNHDFSLLGKFPVRCNHISAIKENFIIEEDEKIRYDSHSFSDLSNFDYLKKYSLELFSDFCALELENSIRDQLQVKDYILKILQNRDAYIKKFLK